MVEDPRSIPRPADGLKAVLLDAGNTLVCIDWHRVAQVLAQVGHEVTPERLLRAEVEGRRVVNRLAIADPSSTDRSRGEHYLRAVLAATGLSGDALERACDGVRDVNRTEGLWRWLPPGTVRALRRLRAAGLTIGVVSNSDGRLSEYLESAGLSPYLDVVVDSHVVGIEKPDPRIFRLALERARAAPAQALFAGDMYAIDVVGARLAGIRAVLIDPLLVDDGHDVVRVRNVADLVTSILDRRPS